MGRRPKNIDENGCYLKCCLCIRKTSRNYNHITDYYIKRRKIEKYDSETLTIYDILEKLGLLNYEIENVEKTIICSHCKKTVFDFFDFKIMTENEQRENQLPMKSEDCFGQIDSIKKYLRSTHYDTLKDYVVKNVIESIDLNDQNELKIMPANIKIKTEMVSDVFSEVNFVDPDILVKIEKTENVDDINFCDDDNDAMSTTSNDPNDETQNSGQTNEYNSDVNDEGNEDELFQAEENELGVTKTVIDNVQFISRIPECLANLEKKRREEEQSGATRTQNVENWRRIIQRNARAKGESYVARGGKVVRARTIQPPCNCRFQCTDRITEADRKRNFENHWGLADFGLQKKFLFEHRKTEPVTRRRGRKENGQKRAYTTKFFLDTYNEDGTFKGQEKVCEVMFCNTFDICKNNLRTLYKKVITGKVEDRRGQNRRAPTPGHLLAVDFVKQFPYFHIEQKMSVRQMYKNYVQECTAKGIDTPVRENTFRNIFSTYNESEFLKEDKKKVKCDFCHEYNRASEQQQAHMQYEFDEHIRANEACRNRRRWRKSTLAKKERRRLQKELQKQQQAQGSSSTAQQVQIQQNALNQQVMGNFGTEMIFY